MHKRCALFCLIIILPLKKLKLLPLNLPITLVSKRHLCASLSSLTNNSTLTECLLGARD